MLQSSRADAKLSRSFSTDTLFQTARFTCGQTCSPRSQSSSHEHRTLLRNEHRYVIFSKAVSWLPRGSFVLEIFIEKRGNLGYTYTGISANGKFLILISWKMSLYGFLIGDCFYVSHSGMKGNDGIIDTNDSIKNDAIYLKCFLFFFLFFENWWWKYFLKFCLLRLSGYDYP